MSKTADEIIGNRAYEIQTPSITPVNQRLLCIDIDPGEVKTDAGIILPGQKAAPAKDGTAMSKPRFIVAAAAGDAIVTNKEGKEYKLQQGDEIYPFWPMDAIGWDFPIVFDYGTQRYYYSLHVSEVAGYIENKPAK